jgi:hypothetical protein
MYLNPNPMMCDANITKVLFLCSKSDRVLYKKDNIPGVFYIAIIMSWLQKKEKGGAAKNE